MDVLSFHLVLEITVKKFFKPIERKSLVQLRHSLKLKQEVLDYVSQGRTRCPLLILKRQTARIFEDFLDLPSLIWYIRFHFRQNKGSLQGGIHQRGSMFVPLLRESRDINFPVRKERCVFFIGPLEGWIDARDSGYPTRPITNEG